MACDKTFSSSYLLLSPEKVGIIDLFRILIHSDVHKRHFVDSSKEGGELRAKVDHIRIHSRAKTSASCGQTPVLEWVRNRVLVESLVEQSKLGKATRQLHSR
ncbi:hypothetical protein NL676_022935 [Syzygium grande]|nr:hypothetical protein NL676_022935 [Syzygium grande]